MTSRRVLIVDDNHDAVHMMTTALALSGHVVQTATDGTSAIRIARSLRPDFLFLDIGLPGLDGFQVAQTLRREPGLESMRIIGVTGYGKEVDRQQALAAGFDHVLLKPVDIAFIESLLGKPRASEK